MLVRIEKLNLNTEEKCNLCDIDKAIARVFTQNKQQHEEGIKNVAFCYCGKCGKEFFADGIRYHT